MRRLPSLAAIRAFEAAARHLSFTKAADELGTTQPGISRHVRILEAQLGRALFLRSNRRVDLTPHGHELAPALARALDDMAAAFARLENRAGRVLAVTAAPSLNPSWLIPRLATFQDRHRDIELRLETSRDVVDLDRSDFDVALRSGDGKWSGLACHKLAEFRLAPLCSPGFLERYGPFSHPGELLAAPLVQRNDPAWPRWFAAAGLPDIDLGAQPAFKLGSRHLFGEAALASRGAALLTPRLYADELADGRLVQPFACVLDQPERAFWFVSSASERRNRAIRLLRDWLSKELADR